MLNSKSMSTGDTGDYVDILVYIYTDFEPEILTSTGGYTYRKFFTGAISPFYTDSVEKHTDRMWYIGKHYTDDEGDPNVQGCGWFTYQNGLETGCFAADDTERTTCEIVDNGDGTHTIKGVMYDKTFDKSLRYEYKTEHPGIFRRISVDAVCRRMFFPTAAFRLRSLFFCGSVRAFAGGVPFVVSEAKDA